MARKIYFDLDGTVYNLYGINNWLDELLNCSADIFLKGEFMVDKKSFMVAIDELLKYGFSFGVITWLSKENDPEKNKIFTTQKIKWIKENLPFINEINIIPYGTPKQKAIQKKAKEMYLIDDNIDVCKLWNTKKQRKAINVNEIFTVIDALNSIIENY